MIAARILSVLAAVFLVGAFALASTLSPDTPLKDALGMVDSGWMPALQRLIQTGLSPWAWDNLAMPVLQRPVWLPPTAIGLIFFGAAVSISGPRGNRAGPRRWRG